ncbi:hypothetical protein [Mycoplasma sp. VS30B]
MKKIIKRSLIPTTIIATALAPIVLLSANDDVNDNGVSVENTEVWKNMSKSYFYEYNDFSQQVAPYKFNEWMKDVNDEKTLFQLSLPGTHDSGMYSGKGNWWNITLARQYAKTQSMNWQEQMNAGIRAFDIRSYYNMDIYHGIVQSQSTVKSALLEMVKFLKENPSEFVFLRIKDENFDVHNSWNQMQAAKNYLEILSDPEIYPHLFNKIGQEYNHIPASAFKLKNLRGKIVIANFWHNAIQSKMLQIEGQYKADTWSGGFDYWSAINKSTQNDNYDSGWDEKIEQSKEFIKKTNSLPFDNNHLYLNFFSVANGRPGWSAEYIDPKMHQFLVENQQYNNLGIVYTDFAGVGLIESIFKTNYYLTDEQLQRGYLTPWNSSFGASDIYVNDNKVTLYGQNLNGYTVDFSLNGKIIYTTTINENVSEKVINLGDDYYFQLGNKIEINAYKMVPDNAFYQGRKYNVVATHKVVRDTQHNQNYLALLQRIGELRAKLTQFGYMDLVKYLGNNYWDKIVDYIRPNKENEIALSNLKEKFDSFESNANNLISNYDKFKQDVANFIQKNNELLSKYLTSELITSISNVKANFEVILKKNITENEINFSSLNQYFIDYVNFLNKLKSNLFIFDTDINDYLAFLRENLKDSDIGISYWINQIQALNSELENLAAKYSDLSQANFDNVEGNITNLKSKLNIVKSDIEDLNLTIKNHNLTNKQLAFFASDIKAELEKPQALTLAITKITTYANNLTQARDLVTNLPMYKASKLFDEHPTSLKTSYENKINVLSNEIQNLNSPITPQTLADSLKSLEKIENTINDVEEYRAKVKTLQIFPNQETYFSNELSQATSSTQAEEIFNQANELAELKPLQIENKEFINSLNENQKGLAKALENLNDPNKFKNKLEELLSLQKATESLTSQYNSLPVIQDYKELKLLDDRNITNFENEYKEIKNILDNSISLEQINSAISQAIELRKSFDQSINNSLEEINDNIKTSNKLYNFQRKELEEKLSNLNASSAISELKTFLDIYNSTLEENLPQKDLDILNNLTENQKVLFAEKFNDVNDKSEYLTLLQEAQILNNIIPSYKSEFSQLKEKEQANVEAIEYADKQDQELLANLKQQIVNALENSINSADIQSLLSQYASILERLINKYNEDLAKAKETLNQSIQEAKNYAENDLSKAEYADVKAELLSIINNLPKANTISQINNENDEVLKALEKAKEEKNKIDLGIKNIVITSLKKEINSLIQELNTKLLNVTSTELNEYSLQYQDQLKKIQLQTNNSNDVGELISIKNSIQNTLKLEIDSFLTSSLKYEEAWKYLSNMLTKASEFNADKYLQIKSTYISEINSLINELKQVISSVEVLINTKDSLYQELKVKADNAYDKALKAKNEVDLILQNKKVLIQKINTFINSIKSQTDELIYNRNKKVLDTLLEKVYQAKNQNQLEGYEKELEKVQTKINGDLAYIQKYNSTSEMLKQYQEKAGEFDGEGYSKIKETYVQALKNLEVELKPDFDINKLVEIQENIKNAYKQALDALNNIKQQLQNSKDKLIQQVENQIENITSLNNNNLNDKWINTLEKLKNEIANINVLSQIKQYQDIVDENDTKIRNDITYSNKYNDIKTEISYYKSKASEFDGEIYKAIKAQYLLEIKGIESKLNFNYNLEELEQLQKELQNAYDKALEAMKNADSSAQQPEPKPETDVNKPNIPEVDEQKSSLKWLWFLILFPVGGLGYLIYFLVKKFFKK